MDDNIQEEVAQDQPEFQNPFHDRKWTKDHPATNIIGNLEEGVKTRSAIANECLCAGLLSKTGPKTAKEALQNPIWIQSM